MHAAVSEGLVEFPRHLRLANDGLVEFPQPLRLANDDLVENPRPLRLANGSLVGFLRDHFSPSEGLLLMGEDLRFPRDGTEGGGISQRGLPEVTSALWME